MDASRMRAIAVREGRGPAENLEIVELPVPEPAEGEILIRVRAAGVNRPDILQRLGAYPPPPGAPETLGLEVAGEVVKGAGRWREGDRVCALLGGGGYAEYARVDARHALPVPNGLEFSEESALPVPYELDFTRAAALPETVFTVWANVFEHGALKAGETLMVHGATSGIGTTAIQMAKAAGARVVATARGGAKAASAREQGADLAIDASTEDFAAAARGFGGADVVLDMVGGPYFEKNLEALNTGGRIVYIASQGGPEIVVPVFRVMAKRGVITGSTLRPRDADEKARIAAELERVVWPWIEAGKVRPVIERAFPLAEAAAAHALLESGVHVGKVVLIP
jgi:NADPH:quinone reductase-like Zn-dependent oxidoreductase